MKIKKIISEIEKIVPLSFQESYDNSGIQTGNINSETNSVLLTLDVTENVVDEAIKLKSSLIISHHPLIFNGLKKLTGNTASERAIIKAIKNDITIYSSHTNMDSAWNGLNIKLAEKIELKNIKILKKVCRTLKKIVTYVPIKHADKVRKSLFNAGAGNIGNYDSCSFNLNGNGTFRAGKNANPFVGKIGKIHNEPEIRIETVFPEHLTNNIIEALYKSHPYEEIAFDIYSLENQYDKQGIGAIGIFDKPMKEIDFLKFIKTKLNCKLLKYSALTNKPIKKVAVCGGSGSFLISDVILQKSDAFVTSDIKYHQFQETENQILLIDAGHFETENHSIEIFYEIINKKFHNFATYFSKENINPVNYL